ncbi:MAG: hypothetical protein ACXW39_10890 [Nitrospira sp.]
MAGYRVALYHRPYERGRLTRDGASFLKRTNPAVCVYGHTHQPKAEWREGGAAVQSRLCRTETVSPATRPRITSVPP